MEPRFCNTGSTYTTHREGEISQILFYLISVKTIQYSKFQNHRHILDLEISFCLLNLNEKKLAILKDFIWSISCFYTCGRTH
jgi:hypothetical protein